MKTPVGDPDRIRALAAVDLTAVLDRLSDGILILADDWTIEYINQPVGEMISRSHRELLGQNIWQEFPEAVGGPFHHAYEQAKRTGFPQRVVEFYEPLDAWFEIRVLPQGDKLIGLIRDVTDLQQVEHDLRQFGDGVAEAERIVRFGVWRWDVASGGVRCSDELQRIYGLGPGEFEGGVDAIVALAHPEDRERVWAELSRSLETLLPFVFRHRIIRVDGVERVLLSQGRVIPGPDGTAETVVGVCHDVSDRARVEQALGLSRRRLRAIVDNTPSMISVKDLEGRYLMANEEFEQVVGQSSGDLLGRRCEDLFPPEIATLQREIDLRAADDSEPVYGEASLAGEDGEDRRYVTATFALPDEHGEPAEICTIATDVTERREREDQRRVRLEWTDRLSTAMKQGRLEIFAQPIVAADGGAQVASELLVRMREDGEGVELIPPADFLLAAERYGLIQEIDTWMVRQALDLPVDETYQVNLSALTMCDFGARRDIIALLRAEPEAARRLIFEITETASVNQLSAAQSFAAQVIAAGSRLALDDFGVGFGSFTYLRSLPFSLLKIDQGFVRGVTTSRDDRRVVQGTIGIAREFGIETIAEGVEDEATMEVLRELGVDYAQGFHLGRPAPLPHGAGASAGDRA